MKKEISVKLVLIGLLSQIDFSQSRAVNISNTWTLPQPGFNVFYRYFRDKISWFEADAVCQFHHANLVTVENIEQFDAARGFLKELDITENVWIGLMRPTNADQFSWTNSKPLPVSEGYWAEPWPVSETPLCAVIDPARDYRWHALRCGGPETASFLCEMEIPEWAIHCTENPEITVQYISDSGAVQLSRHCKDSLKEISCQGKLNQMEMYNELKCSEELTTAAIIEVTSTESSEPPTTTEENLPKVIIKNPQKMLEDIFNDPETAMEVDTNRLEVSDNKKGDIDLMVGDQPVFDAPTEDKKTLLKLSDKKEAFPKKSKSLKKEKTKESLTHEDVMMGDQPAVDESHEELSTTIHLKSDSTSPAPLTTDRQRRDASSLETTISAEEKASSEIPSTTQQSDLTTFADSSTPQIGPEILSPTTAEAQQVTTAIIEETTTKFFVQGHPLHMSQAIFKEPISVDNANEHERKDVGNSDDHFIPPMLLVKARFTAKSTEGATEELATEILSNPISESTLDIQAVTDISNDDKNGTILEKSTESSGITTNEILPNVQIETTLSVATEKPILIEKRNDPRLGLNAITTTTTTTTMTPKTTELSLTTVEILSSSMLSTTDEPTTITDESSSPSYFVSTTFSDFSTTDEVKIESSSIETLTESSSSEISSIQNSSPLPEALKDSETETKAVEVLSSTQKFKPSAEKLIESTTPKIETSTRIQTTFTPIAIKQTTIKIPETSINATPQPQHYKLTTIMTNDINANHHTSQEKRAKNHEHHQEDEMSNENESSEHHADFTNADEDQPYKHNRHRSIMKNDHHHGPGFSIGKILG